MEPATSRTDFFDRRFVGAATVIGCIYALIVVALTQVIGKEAAGAAGIALTALATGIFRQFESLRFRALAQHEYRDVPLPQPDKLLLVLLALAFHGGQKIFGLVMGIVFAVFSLLPATDSIESMLSSIWGDWKIVASLVVGHGMAILLVSFLAARALTRLRYSTILFAILLAALIDLCYPLAIVAADNPSDVPAYLASGALWPAVFWSAFLAIGLLGAWLAHRGRPAAPLPATDTRAGSIA
jgi:hypothetical protein